MNSMTWTENLFIMTETANKDILKDIEDECNDRGTEDKNQDKSRDKH